MSNIDMKLPAFRKRPQPTKSEILKMDLSEYFQFIIDPKAFSRAVYENMKEYYGDYLTEDVVNKFKLSPKIDYVLENLNTHDSDTFLRKLKEHFHQFRIMEFRTTDREKRYIKLTIYDSEGESAEHFANSKRFVDFCNFFGYTISKVLQGTENCAVKLEPRFAESANDLVYNKCFGKIYHITSKSNAEKILKSGLRVRSGKYRDFPNRIYFVAIPPKKQSIETREEIVDAIDLYIPYAEVLSGFCILKIDIYGTNLNFYMDSVSEDDAKYMDKENVAVYTYNNIPPKFISVAYDSTEDK